MIGSGPPAVDLGVPEPPGSRWRDLTTEQGARGALIAAASTVVALGLALWWVLSSEAWPAVQQQFFNPENFAEAWPDVVGGFWLDVRMFLVAEVAILAFSLLLAVIRGAPGTGVLPAPHAHRGLHRRDAGHPHHPHHPAAGLRDPGAGPARGSAQPPLLGLTALVLSYSAYTAEVYRAGIESVHESQRMSARALGLTQWQALQYVLVPQAVRNVVPALLNGFVSLQKDVALVYILGIREAVPRGADLQRTHLQLHRVRGGGGAVPGGLDSGGPVRRLVHRAGPAAEAGGMSTSGGTAGHKVEVRSVSKAFDGTPVLVDVDLAVAEHDVVCLIGASGSGKSTMLKCIDLLVPIDSGEIVLDGRVISGRGVDADEVRHRMGIVFQAFNLFPHMSVLDNITLSPRRVHEVGRAEAEMRARELLDRFGLADRADDFPDRLSGGQQQRVAIVRALATNPEVMLLDEITSALDPELVAEVLDVVRQLKTDGMTMVIATHEMGFARDIADRVCFLDGGGILEQGPAATIFTRPGEDRTRQFLQRIIDAGRL